MNVKSLNLDKILLGVLIVLLLLHYFSLIPKTIDDDTLFAVSALATLPVLWSAFKSVKSRKISVDLLASIALVASLLAEQWASAAFINLMLTSARIFGDYTSNKARAAIKSLLKLRPEKVKIKKGDQFVIVPEARVQVGDLVVIESGERIPTDGTVVQGEADIDQSSLTGESVPIPKKAGDRVYSSTLNISGSLIVKTEKVGKDTTLQKIIDLVEKSQEDKSTIHSVSEKFATWYIVLTLIAAIVIYLGWRDLNLLLSVLLVACADDIAVSIPMAFLAAIGYAARRGVIIKGGNFLEGLTKLKKIIVDKTGTLTRGKLKIQDVFAFAEFSQDEILKMAATTVYFSEHPVAKAIIEHATEKKIIFEKPKAFKEIPGKGVSATIGQREILSGNINFLKAKNYTITSHALADIKRVENQGFNVTLIGTDKKLVGFLALADKIRPSLKEVIAKTKNLGVENWIMLTGDNENVAGRIASEAGITEFHANLSPQDKLDYIKNHLSKDYKTAMIGDGVNDAAAITLADIGIAMGAIGSDASIESADIALMRDDLKEVPEMIDLGLYTKKIARQDFWIWGITNALGVILVFSSLIGPEGAAAFNFVTDFFPLLNSLRLFNLHLKL